MSLLAKPRLQGSADFERSLALISDRGPKWGDIPFALSASHGSEHRLKGFGRGLERLLFFGPQLQLKVLLNSGPTHHGGDTEADILEAIGPVLKGRNWQELLSIESDGVNDLGHRCSDCPAGTTFAANDLRSTFLGALEDSPLEISITSLHLRQG